MSRLKIALLAEEAVEIPEEEQAAAAAPVEEIAAGDAQVADDLAEVATENEQVVEAFDDASAAADEAAIAHDNIQAAADAGTGVDEVAMESYMQTLGMIRRMAGLPPAVIRGVGRESFGSRITRQEATRKLALEGFMDTLKSIIDKIAAGFRAAWEAVKSFFKNLFDAVGRTREKAEKLKKLAEGLKGKAGKSDMRYKLGGLFTNVAKQLQLNGRVPAGKDMVSGYQKSLATLTQVLQNLNKDSIKASGDAVGELAKTIADSQFDAIAAKQIRGLALSGLKETGNDKVKTPEGWGTFSGEAILGDRALWQIAPKQGSSDEQVLSGMSAYKAWIGDSLGRKDAKEEDIQVMEPADAIALADEVLGVCKSFDEVKDGSKEMKAALDKALSGVKSAKGDDASAKNLSKLSGMCSILVRLGNGALTSVRKTMLDISSAAITYAASSMSQISKGGADVDAKTGAPKGQLALPAPAKASGGSQGGALVTR